MYIAFAAWGTLNIRRAASPLVRLVEGEERWETPDHPQGFASSKLGWNKKNRTAIGMVLKTNDRFKNLTLSRDEFHWPRSGILRQVALVTTTELLINL
ncbi:hypothetical protein TNCV_733771 [Trichonephila clavipes]|nr:hypothetical protein TNCV_733771 [Trichonephila clavipes]